MVAIKIKVVRLLFLVIFRCFLGTHTAAQRLSLSFLNIYVFLVTNFIKGKNKMTDEAGKHLLFFVVLDVSCMDGKLISKFPCTIHARSFATDKLLMGDVNVNLLVLCFCA